MSKYGGAEDTYRELVEESDQSWLLGLVAFAVVEEQRVEWMRHHEKLHGALPTPEEIRNWYGQQPASVLLRAKGTAESALQLYSEEVSALLDSQYKKEIEQGILVGEIRAVNKFWPQLGVNIAGGLASTILFTALLIIVAIFVFNDTSPVELVKKSNQTTEAPTNGN